MRANPPSRDRHGRALRGRARIEAGGPRGAGAAPAPPASGRGASRRRAGARGGSRDREGRRVRRRRRARTPPRGKKAPLPARLTETEAPVRLLAEEEVVLVEQTDLLDRLAPGEHAGTHHEIRLANLVVLEAARAERVERARAGAQLPREEVL